MAKVTRRSLLSLFAVAPLVAAVDPEKRLWVPGKKLVSIPAIAAVSLPRGFKEALLYDMALRLGTGNQIQFHRNAFALIAPTLTPSDAQAIFEEIRYLSYMAIGLNPSRNADHGHGVSSRPVEAPVR